MSSPASGRSADCGNEPRQRCWSGRNIDGSWRGTSERGMEQVSSAVPYEGAPRRPAGDGRARSETVETRAHLLKASTPRERPAILRLPKIPPDAVLRPRLFDVLDAGVDD